MPSYQYQALKISDRSRLTGLINAANEKEARELLREQDLIPTQLKIISNATDTRKKGLNPIIGFFQNFMGVSSKQKIAFSRNIGIMVRAGIPLTESLLYFETYSDNAKFKRIVSQIRRDILTGYSFSQALSKHSKVFSEVFINVTRAGEASGELEVTMERMTTLQVKSDQLKMKIISAAVYPCIVLCIVGIVLLLMFVFVIPTFVGIYQQMGIKLPLPTQIMVTISDILRNFWWITIPAIAGSIFGFFKYFTSAGGKLVLDLVLIRLPVLGDVVKLVNNSHFISTFHVSFSAGIPITEALSLSAQTVAHTQMREALQKVNVQIQTGQRLGVALTQTGYIPDLVLLMISTGEESGELERMLQTSQEYIEEEINHRVGILTSLMEPLMLIVLGLVVGFVALSIYLPLFSMYEHM